MNKLIRQWRGIFANAGWSDLGSTAEQLAFQEGRIENMIARSETVAEGSENELTVRAIAALGLARAAVAEAICHLNEASRIGIEYAEALGAEAAEQ